MKKAVWFTGIFVIVSVLIIGCYLLFFREKNSEMPEGTFVRTEGMWREWKRSA